MRKRGKKLVAMALATSMALGTVSMSAFADEPNTSVATDSNAILNEDGTTTDQTITTTTTTDSETGNVTVKVEITENTSGTNTDGAVVDGTMSSVKETTTDADGNMIKETYVEDGSEVTITEEDVVVGDKGQPEVKVELKPDEKTEVTEIGNYREFEEKFGENGIDYESKEVISEIERIVQAELSKETEVKDEGTVNLTPTIAPENYDGKSYDAGQVSPSIPPTGLTTTTSKDYLANSTDVAPETGYDYHLVGEGDATFAAVPVFMSVVYVKDNEGNTVYEKNDDGTDKLDENGKPIPVIDWEKTKLAEGKNGRTEDGMITSPGQMVLKKDGEYFYVYCIDQETEADLGAWYKVENLEDADYYSSDDSAEKLRAVVSNGYWGTKEGTGSLDNIKKMMRETYDETAEVTVTDKDGKEVTYRVVDLIDGLKEHEALACTQGAIWSYSNGSLDVQNGEDGNLVIGIQSSDKFFNSRGGWLDEYYRDYNLESDARMKALYECLMGLEGKEAADVIINEKNSVEDMTLVVGDKAVLDVEDTRNTDDNPDNDVYNTKVEFTLAFVPDTNDNIYVYVLDKDGNRMTDAAGKEIVRKLAAEGSQEEGAITAVNGVYTLDGLVFQENTNVEFKLQLSGVQNLDEGVYIYKAHGGYSESQTLVGIAGGEQEVNVTKSMELTFNVDEKKKVTATSKWHREDEDTYTPEPNDPPSNPEPNDPPSNPEPNDPPSNPEPNDPPSNPEPNDPPSNPEPNEPSKNDGGSREPRVEDDTFEIVEIVDEDVPLSDGVAVLGAMEIEDDLIPLAVLPATGDNSLWLMIVSLFSGLSLAGASFVDKMKKRRR